MGVKRKVIMVINALHQRRHKKLRKQLMKEEGDQSSASDQEICPFNFPRDSDQTYESTSSFSIKGLKRNQRTSH